MSVEGMSRTTRVRRQYSGVRTEARASARRAARRACTAASRPSGRHCISSALSISEQGYSLSSSGRKSGIVEHALVVLDVRLRRRSVQVGHPVRVDLEARLPQQATPPGASPRQSCPRWFEAQHLIIQALEADLDLGRAQPPDAQHLVRADVIGPRLDHQTRHSGRRALSFSRCAASSSSQVAYSSTGPRARSPRAIRPRLLARAAASRRGKWPAPPGCRSASSRVPSVTDVGGVALRVELRRLAQRLPSPRRVRSIPSPKSCSASKMRLTNQIW